MLSFQARSLNFSKGMHKQIKIGQLNTNFKCVQVIATRSQSRTSLFRLLLFFPTTRRPHCPVVARDLKVWYIPGWNTITFIVISYNVKAYCTRWPNRSFVVTCTKKSSCSGEIKIAVVKVTSQWDVFVHFLFDIVHLYTVWDLFIIAIHNKSY